MACMEHQTDRAHGSSQHSDQGRCVEEAKEPALDPSPAHFRGHLVISSRPLMLMDLSSARSKLKIALLNCLRFRPRSGMRNLLGPNRASLRFHGADPNRTRESRHENAATRGSDLK